MTTDPDEIERLLGELDGRFLEKGRELYEAGDKSKLLYCLYHCLRHNRPIPDWIKEALRHACYLVRSHQVKSWDDVFGRPIKSWSDRRLAAERHKDKIAQDIWDTVNDRSNAGEPRDDGLFASVGEQFGVGSTVAKEIYYEIARDALATDEELINRMSLPISGRRKKRASAKNKKRPEV
jgi:hypothetical protein